MVREFIRRHQVPVLQDAAMTATGASTRPERPFVYSALPWSSPTSSPCNAPPRCSDPARQCPLHARSSSNYARRSCRPASCSPGSAPTYGRWQQGRSPSGKRALQHTPPNHSHLPFSCPFRPHGRSPFQPAAPFLAGSPMSTREITRFCTVSDSARCLIQAILAVRHWPATYQAANPARSPVSGGVAQRVVCHCR